MKNKYKAIIFIVIALFVIILICYDNFESCFYDLPESAISEVYSSSSEICVEISESAPVEAEKPNLNAITSIAEIETLIQECNSKQSSAEKMAAAARELGYGETHMVISLAKQEWNEAELFKSQCSQRIDEIWEEREGEYPIATYVWEFLKSQGYNDYVCAGIIGNMMVETGGQTLALKYRAYGQGYYGLCQWSKSYSDIWGKGLEDQCNYLINTIKYEMNVFGNIYKLGFGYESFLKLNNERDAAKAFAKCYERCSSKGYSRRQKCATIAYNYFCG